MTNTNDVAVALVAVAIGIVVGWIWAVSRGDIEYTEIHKHEYATPGGGDGGVE